ncbi:hypothetical protein GC176_14935 [bacterium]|nr:hypothetical protein [bacterium]
MKKRSSEEQIAFVLRQLESGTAVSEIVRKMGILGAGHGHVGGLPPENWSGVYESFRPIKIGEGGFR